MNHSTSKSQYFAASAMLFAAALSAPAIAQSTDPQGPAEFQRGNLGQPFPGFVEDIAVVGPDRFVLAISDRPDGGGLDRVQIFTPREGLIGRPFESDQGKIYDVAAAPDGGFWVLYAAVEPASDVESEALAMRLQRFDRDGRPSGDDLLISDSRLTDIDPLYTPRRGWITPLQSGGVAVAFTNYSSTQSRHDLRFINFYPDGGEGPGEVLETNLLHMPYVSTLPLTDGSLAFAWGSNDPMGGGHSMTIFQPDGEWSDSEQSIWSSSSRRGLAFNLRLAPIVGSEEFAAVFSVGGEQVWQRFDRNGVAQSGVETLNSTSLLINPLWIDDERLVGLADGERPRGLYSVAQGDAEPSGIQRLDTEITAFAAERTESVVVAAVVPPRPDAGAEARTFSYLYRAPAE